MKIFLIRHGESMQNTKENYSIGLPDHKVYLTEQGKEEARLAGEFLKKYIVDNKINISNSVMWVSPYTRTRETASIINEQLSIKKVKEDITLIEQQYGLFSEKALDFIDNSDAFINILHGSVRSSKTTNVNVRWLEFIVTSPHDRFLMTGKTRDTLERNVIDDLIKMIHGKIYYDYNKYDGYLDIGDKRIYLVGFNDEGATDKIRGMTVGGWYADEAATAPESAMKMAINRCSLPGAKIFWTMNPDRKRKVLLKYGISH